MVQPPPRISRALTGRVRLRRGYFGRVIAQVEVQLTSYNPWSPERVIAIRHEWRDAKSSDLPIIPEPDCLPPTPPCAAPKPEAPSSRIVRESGGTTLVYETVHVPKPGPWPPAPPPGPNPRDEQRDEYVEQAKHQQRVEEARRRAAAPAQQDRSQTALIQEDWYPDLVGYPRRPFVCRKQD